MGNPLSTELAPGVHRVPTLPFDLINSFVILEDDGSVTLVDAGLKTAPRRLVAALRALGHDLRDVRRVVLTHAHPGHAAGLARLADGSGGEVLAHERDAVHLRDGRAARSDPSTIGGRLVNRFGSGTWEPVEVAATFRDGDLLPVAGGTRVVHTPGHSPGHVSLLLERAGVLITGDAVVNVRGLRYAPKSFCTDVALSRSTADRLADLEFTTVAFTHGAEVRSQARESLRAFLRGRAR